MPLFLCSSATYRGYALIITWLDPTGQLNPENDPRYMQRACPRAVKPPLNDPSGYYFSFIQVCCRTASWSLTALPRAAFVCSTNSNQAHPRPPFYVHSFYSQVTRAALCEGPQWPPQDSTLIKYRHVHRPPFYGAVKY